ncbi:hypothetical protein QRX60_43935 [Amycolatopsis mongoliensis]|uniref:Uncharacterized protein n=1 Tax=Amycolatopsis mongoliensis TaxID=715475 RepID=A0A9Y2NKA4_9PSEU|nr:hypothetical protein [Amycolatopsis sp. 4-36]WIY00930.1 hypothetical protein QRX60_43935 [Amycolatopsis sp. 4-36]
MTEKVLETTRRFLHGAAELLLAGPQHRETGRIDLRVADGGFGTAAAPDLRIEGDELLTGFGRFPLNGRSYDDVAAAAGLQAGEPAGVYGGGPGVRTDEVIILDADAVETLMAAFADGDRALREFAPDSTPILWPEHFDVAITLDQVNYGVSPGDQYVAEPYAYVGPFEPRQGEFWNAPFGAARTMAELGDADAVARFFRTGRELTARRVRCARGSSFRFAGGAAAAVRAGRGLPDPAGLLHRLRKGPRRLAGEEGDRSSAAGRDPRTG